MSRDNLLKRINALRQRTTAAGCTEAEALAAASKAAELMREYDLGVDQLGMSEEWVGTKISPQASAAGIWGSIGHCTNTHPLFSRHQTERRVIYVGLEPGPVIACYLSEVCENALKTELAKFRKGDFYRKRRSEKTRRAASNDFVLGLVGRLRQRLRQLFEDRIDNVKSAAASVELAARYPDTGTVRRRKTKVRYDAAVDEGWRAGGNVNLAHGVNGRQTKPLLIGGAP